MTVKGLYHLQLIETQSAPTHLVIYIVSIAPRTIGATLWLVDERRVGELACLVVRKLSTYRVAGHY